MRYSLSCNCCGACVYEASDGNVYSDDFSGTLDANWDYADNDPFGTDDTLQITSGKLEAVSNGLNNVPKWILHTTDDGVYAYSGLKVILEVDIYEVDFSKTQAVSVTLSSAVTWQVNADWTNGTFGLSEVNGPSGVTLSQAPVDGDKITIIVEHVSGYTWRICGYVNEENFGEISTEYNPGQPNVIVTPFLPYDHDTATTGDKLVSFDNYTVHIGNP